ncbi:hypothetical protein KIH86_05910 [Paenibacillus sp. HN-1]|uniref:siroheme decarboxylase subunit beta n=1 Tax=Paenibacillus TaxID=44249 RepID=UPI001CA7D889|nr:MULTISPECIES: Lrp/AsnC family transcriptional regulator [Paenibacillus]MBY9078029.1 hypothetical protein [Paenibacillus sp. CGMCC 1.18879]MBY9083770.1 hypothetical protein [Paenibacillus sinensis]
MPLDLADKKLLNRLQIGLPLVKRPWNCIEDELQLPFEDIRDRLERLKQEGFIRRIGGVFNPSALGYRGCLYAMEVDESCFAHTTAVVNQFKGVTHNYRRRNRLNMWFTLSSRYEAERIDILREIGEAAGHTRIYAFPTKRVFKLRVFLNMEEHAADAERCGSASKPLLHPSDDVHWEHRDWELIRELQGSLPLSEHPFDEISARIGCGSEEVLQRLHRLQSAGALKRIAAVLMHRQAGYTANGLFVAAVPEALLEEAGSRLASYAEVSHCYERQAYPEWPYNLYAMIHGTGETLVRSVAERFALKEGIGRYELLFSTAELKKTSFTI